MVHIKEEKWCCKRVNAELQTGNNGILRVYVGSGGGADQEIVVEGISPMLEEAAVDKVTVLAAEAAVVVLRQLVLQTLF